MRYENTRLANRILGSKEKVGNMHRYKITTVVEVELEEGNKELLEGLKIEEEAYLEDFPAAKFSTEILEFKPFTGWVRVQ
jgi:hypothetical protein